jgi:hypothetical protein
MISPFYKVQQIIGSERLIITNFKTEEDFLPKTFFNYPVKADFLQ